MIKQVDSFDEILKCSKLIHSFMKSTKQDYTEKDLYNMLPNLLKNGAMFYIEEDEPKAYCILVRTVMVDKPASLLFQVYAPVHKYSEMLYKYIRDFLVHNNVLRVVALVDPDDLDYYVTNYGMEVKQVLMQWDIEPPTLQEVRDKTIELEVGGNGKKEGEGEAVRGEISEGRSESEEGEIQVTEE